MRSLTLAILAMMTVAQASEGQRRTDVSDRAGLPRDVAREASRLYNESAAIRSSDRVEINRSRVVDGDVAVLNGPVIISGRVRGRVLAINSDVVLRPSARIDGDLLVVGGEVEGRHAAYVGGEIRIYRQRLRYTTTADGIEPERTTYADETGWWRKWEPRQQRSGSSLHISAGAYNRVEGLPINVGPRIRHSAPWGSAQLDAYAIARTETSFNGNQDDIGHNVNAELRFGRWGGLLLGGRAFDVVDPTEQWQLSDLEASLAAFLARRDYRDYYERHGGSVRAGGFIRRGVDVFASYGRERWISRPTESPWTLTRQGAAWRPNPAFDAGVLRLFTSTVRIDTRNDREDPWSGWFVNAELEHGFGEDMDYAPRAAPIGLSSPNDIQYARAFVDMRRYNRVSPNAQLNLRLVAGGWMNGDPLPLQRRFALDGPGAMPGYDFRSPSSQNYLTCTTGAFVPGMPGQCDRMALAQVEYRGDLHFDIFSDWDDDHYSSGHSPGVWVFFADAGRGWLVGNPGDTLTYSRNEIPPLSTFRTDLGLGLDFDVIGVYVAKAMTAPSQPANFFLRIRHRF